MPRRRRGCRWFTGVFYYFFFLRQIRSSPREFECRRRRRYVYGIRVFITQTYGRAHARTHSEDRKRSGRRYNNALVPTLHLYASTSSGSRAQLLCVRYYKNFTYTRVVGNSQSSLAFEPFHRANFTVFFFFFFPSPPRPHRRRICSDNVMPSSSYYGFDLE